MRIHLFSILFLFFGYASANDTLFQSYGLDWILFEDSDYLKITGVKNDSVILSQTCKFLAKYSFCDKRVKPINAKETYKEGKSLVKKDVYFLFPHWFPERHLVEEWTKLSNNNDSIYVIEEEIVSSFVFFSVLACIVFMVLCYIFSQSKMNEYECRQTILGGISIFIAAIFFSFGIKILFFFNSNVPGIFFFFFFLSSSACLYVCITACLMKIFRKNSDKSERENLRRASDIGNLTSMLISCFAVANLPIFAIKSAKAIPLLVTMFLVPVVLGVLSNLIILKKEKKACQKKKK